MTKGLYKNLPVHVCTGMVIPNGVVAPQACNAPRAETIVRVYVAVAVAGTGRADSGYRRETTNGWNGTRDRDQEGGGRADMSPRRTAAHSVISATSKAVRPHLSLL